MEEEKKSKKGKKIARNIFGGLFLLAGISNIGTSSFLSGIFMMLFGISLLPIFYDKTKLNIKHIQIILPITLLIIAGIVMPQETTQTNEKTYENNTNMIQENNKIEITKLQLEETEIELDIKETRNIVLEILPEGADMEDIEFCTSNNEIAILEKVEIKKDENKIILKIQPIAEGNCEIFVKSANEIESNKVIVKIVDKERIEQEEREKEEQARREAEEKARREAEEQAKKQAEEQARKQAEEQARKVAEEQARKQRQEQAQKKTTQSSTNSNNSHGRVVYRTPSGKRYHFDPDCGGKNSYQTTLDSGKSVGLTPCQKCAK